jgi:guanylate kinase
MSISGQLFIVSAPSGAGKTSLVKALVEKHADIVLSVSHTTRAPRLGEVDGEDYHFVSQIEFDRMRDAGEFLESATVFDHAYGTSTAAVSSQLAQGQDIILEIDWQGAGQLRRSDLACKRIFILPPSKAELESRLRGRGQDDDAVIARRMRDAKSEMAHYVEFDYVVINDEFEQALVDLEAIIVAQRLSVARQSQVETKLIQELLA